MIHLFIIILCLVISINFSFSQETEPDPSVITEEQLENQTETEGSEIENDSYLQQLQYYKKHPLNLNDAEANDLKQFAFLTPLHIENFVRYRNLLGKFITVYELQAIPSWDVETIKKLLPFIVVSDHLSLYESFAKRLLTGTQAIQFRFSEILGKAPGFGKDSSSSRFMGSRAAMLLRYKYSYKNLLQYGLTADKDAGEQFFKGAQKHGFDFYSFHFFVKKIRNIRSFAVGDFTVNLGQGLIQWQGLGFKKSASVLEIKRQSEILQPYNSAGEFNFHRGIGITLQRKDWELSGFISARKLSGNIKTDSFESIRHYVSSLLTSGNHRTLSELEDRNRIQAIIYGGNISYQAAGGNVGLNMVRYRFSKPFETSGEPYDLFGLTGKTWSNYSMDFSYTFRNMHLYGEFAVDKNLNTALVQGVIASLDPKINVALVYRRIDKAYQSLFSNAFTENAFPTNESGLYTAVFIRPVNAWRVDLFADVFQFPWLKFRSDAPGFGKDFLIQVTYTPGKQLEFYSLYRQTVKQSNLANSNLNTRQVESTERRTWRTHLCLKVNHAVQLRNRLEIVWYNKRAGGPENGFLAYTDISFKSSRPYAGNFRIQVFETEGFNSRIYVYENDVLFSHNIPAFSDKGIRWYLNLNTDLTRIRRRTSAPTFHVQLWLRLAQTIHINNINIGTGLNQASGLSGSEIKFQILLSR